MMTEYNPYFTGLYPNFHHPIRYAGYPFPPYVMPPPDFGNLNLQETISRKRSNLPNSNDAEQSATSLKTSMTQTKSKKRDKKRRKPIVVISSSDTSDYGLRNVPSIPVKEERQLDKKIEVTNICPSENRTADFGPGIVDVQATELGGRYNLKIALKMKPADAITPNETKSSIVKCRAANSNNSSKSYSLKSFYSNDT